ncbi:MAG: hypothetical protein ACFE78_05000 [Candidatus Hodarchaeota archaeon]
MMLIRYTISILWGIVFIRIMCLSHSFLNINPEPIVLDLEIFRQGMNIPFYQQFL